MQFSCYNGAMQSALVAPTFPLPANQLTTLIQLSLKVPARIKRIYVSLDNTAANVPGSVELLECATVFATVSQYVAADLSALDGEALNNGDPTVNLINVGTINLSGYNASSEGNFGSVGITGMRNLKPPLLLPPTGPLIHSWSLGDEPYIQAAKSLRVRAKFATNVNILCGLVLAF